jgi:hypothetical protein
VNCACFQDLKERLKNEAAGKLPDLKGATVESVDLDGECFIFHGNNLEYAFSIGAELHHSPIGRKTKTRTSVVAKYCPICGKLIFDGEDGDTNV